MNLIKLLLHEDTVDDFSSFNVAGLKEVETNELSKSTRVVVVDGLGITKGLQDRAGEEERGGERGRGREKEGGGERGMRMRYSGLAQNFSLRVTNVRTHLVIFTNKHHIISCIY